MNISALACQACEQQDTIEMLQSNKRNAADIEATYKMLLAVKQEVLQLYSDYALFSPRLDIKTLQKAEIAKIQKDVQQQQENFQQQTQTQVKELRTILSAIQRTKTKISNEWQRYAENRLRPYLDLIDMVSSLPEIRAQEATVHKLVDRLKGYTTRMPQTGKELEDFEACFGQLQKLLANLNDLHSDVREFLQKTRAGQATLADVTDEVLNWCRRGEQAKAFHISF